MRHPNALYIGDQVRADDHDCTVAAFVKPAGGRQLIRVRFPDGSYRNRSFDSLELNPPGQRKFAAQWHNGVPA